MSGEWRVEDRAGTATGLHDGWPSVEHSPAGRAVAVCRVSGPSVVLGSTQPAGVVDGQRAASLGVTVARRRSGGGAVLVTPEDPVWVDMWVPVGDPLWTADIGRAFDWLGDAWVAALGTMGVTGVSAHRGGTVARSPWSRLVCFGGVGTGEVVTGDGRKVVGLAQRRNRDGAWFHGACLLRWEPQWLVGLLALSASERVAAVAALGAAAVGVGDIRVDEGGPSIDADHIAASVIASLP